MTEKFISVSDFVDYLGTLPKDVRGMIFQHLANKEKLNGLCRVIEVHTNLVAKENEELAAEISENRDLPGETGEKIR